jgi:hypothetical protein
MLWISFGKCWLGRPHATRADLRIDLLWRATDLTLSEDTWMEQRTILQSLSVYITEARAQIGLDWKDELDQDQDKEQDSTRIHQDTTTASINTLQCFLQFFPDDKVYKLSSYCFPQHPR